VRILVCMAHSGYVRNFEFVLRAWAEQEHDVHLMLDRMEKRNLPGHDDLLADLQAEYPNITSAQSPDWSDSEWPTVGLAFRTAMDYLRYLEPPFEGATKLRERAERRAPGLRRLAGLRAFRKPCVRLVRAILQLAQRTIPPVPTVLEAIADHRPDVVVVTPLVEIGSKQTEYVRAARHLGLPTCLPVASWDNLTTKGLISDVPDVVTVWNERQVQECELLHGVRRDRVVVTGAVAYDHWFRWSPSRSREDFCAAIGLEPTRPFVLYLGSSGFIAPDEAAFAARLIKGLRAANGGRLAHLQVLVRPHPINPLRGSGPGETELAMLDNVVVYPLAGANPTDDAKRRDYFDSIYHSSAALGVNTSGFVETSIINRPIHVLLAPEYATTQKGTLHFHHLLPENGGMLLVANSFEELGAALECSLAHGDDGRNRRFVAHFIRPFGLDKPASPRLVELVERLGSGERVTGHAGPDPLTPAEALVGRAVALGGRSYVRRRKRRERARNAAKQHASTARGSDPVVASRAAQRQRSEPVKSNEGGRHRPSRQNSGSPN
jgi:hypothetical protein